jgi:hypothetical protein
VVHFAPLGGVHVTPRCGPCCSSWWGPYHHLYTSQQT